jgi:hypothetical protein
MNARFEGGGPNELVVWVMYQEPGDYPGKIVVRAQTIKQGKVQCWPFPSIVAPSTTNNFSAIVEWMHRNPNLYWVPAEQGECPFIVGTWI